MSIGKKRAHSQTYASMRVLLYNQMIRTDFADFRKKRRSTARLQYVLIWSRESDAYKKAN